MRSPQIKFVTGKICRLRDFTGSRTWGVTSLFFYIVMKGFYTAESFEVLGKWWLLGAFPNPLLYDGCKIKGIGGKDGTPLTVDTSANPGTGVARGGNGVVGAVGIKVPAENTAANVLNQTSVTIEADGWITETQFDRFGYPTCSKTPEERAIRRFARRRINMVSTFFDSGGKN